jgi:DNA-directed RNA polymerase subunit RPC12/RpoP
MYLGAGVTYLTVALHRVTRSHMIQACAGCGREFETLQGKYAPDGSIVCVTCGEKMAAAQVGIEKKSASSAFVGAFGSVLIALVSFAVQHRVLFFLFPVLAIAGGGGTAYTALRSRQAREALGWKRIPTIIIGILAILLGLLSLSRSFTQ